MIASERAQLMSKIMLILSGSDCSQDGRLDKFVNISNKLDLNCTIIAYRNCNYDRFGTLSSEQRARISLLIENAPKLPQPSLLKRLDDIAHIALAAVVPVNFMAKILSNRPRIRQLNNLALKTSRFDDENLLIVAKHWTMLPTAILMAKNRKTLIWYDINEVMDEEHNEKIIWKTLYRPVIKRFLKKHKKIISLSTVTSFHQKIEVENNSFYLPNIKKTSHKKANVLENTNIRILYNGLLIENRFILEFLDALKISGRDDINFTMRGYGPDRFLKKIKRKIETLCLEKRVELLMPVQNSKVAEFSSDFDLGVFLHRNTTLQLTFSEPNKVYEYIAAGLAIVATDTPSMNRIVKRNDIGKVIASNPNSINELVSFIKNLNKSDINKWQKNSRLYQRRLIKENHTNPIIQALENN